jgi:hypothetical protein
MNCQCEHAEHDNPCLYPACYRVSTNYGKFDLCEYCYDMNHMPCKFVENIPPGEMITIQPV